MIKVTFIEPGGQRHEVQTATGYDLMTVAVNNMIPGILGECGGNCSCGTCLVSLDSTWQGKAGNASELERSIISGYRSCSEDLRLACQIALTEDLDGLEISLLDEFY